MWGWKHVNRSMGTGVWGCEHGAWGWERGDRTVKQFFSGCVLSKIFVYGDGKMMLWFCGCLLSKNVITWFAHHCCLSPMPVAFALRLCQSMLPVAIHCCCSFLWVLVFYIWRSKHFNRSVERKAWGCKHGTKNEAFFSGCLLSEIFGWRQNSEVFFSCCVLSTWGWELGDGTVWKFFLSFYFTSKLSPLPPKKFISWFQFTTILTGALVHWQSFVKQNLSYDFSSLTLAIAHCTQLPLPVAVHRHCPSPLPISVSASFLHVKI